MIAAFVNPYLTAVEKVFNTMIGTQVAMSKPELKHDKLTWGDVTGVMEFGGHKRGTFSLSFTKTSALFAYKALMGEEAETITDEVIDFVGEMTNIISGQVRAEIEKLGYNLSGAVPTVVVGQNVEIDVVGKVPMVVLSFTFRADDDIGHLYLDFSFE